MTKTLLCLVLICLSTSIVHGANANHPCGDDTWTMYKDEKCFKLFKSFETRHGADDVCNQQSSTLVTIKSAAEQIFLIEYVFDSSDSNSVWIGAERRLDSSTEFDWNDGTPVQRFVNWAIGRPSDVVSRSCVVMQSIFSRSLEMEWVDVNCNNGNWYICEKLQSWDYERLQRNVLNNRRELQYSIESFTNQMNEVKNIIATHADQLNSFTNQMTEMRNTVTGQATQINSLTNQIADTRNTLTTQSTQLNNLTNQMTDTTNFLTTQATQINSLTNETTDMRNTLTAQTTQLNNLTNQMTDTRNTLTTQTTQLNSLTNQMTDTTNTVTAQGSHLNNLTNQMTDTRNTVNTQGTQLNSLTNQMTDTRNTVNTQGTQLNSLTNQMTNTTNTVTAQGTQLNSLTNQMTDTRNTLTTQGTQLNSLTNHMTDTRNTVTTQGTQLNNLTSQMTDTRNTLTTQSTQVQALQANPVPIGFIYVQLPNQTDPRTIWTTVEWSEVTSQYAGLFFRAQGGDSAAFGSVQSENSPRITSIVLSATMDIRHGDTLNPGTTTMISSGPDVNNASTYWGLQFQVSSGEVRPRNQAMRIWKRIK